MLTIEDTANINHYYSDTLKDNVLFFDIETTGFSPDVSSLYLIGCLYFKEDKWNLVQWFADDYISEKSILIEFFEFLRSFKVIVHYNGTGFDIPYLLKKCKKYNLSFNFNEIESFDLYKKITFLKPILKLKNLKQKTVEEFLGILREDPFDGGELISVYCDYMKNKIFSKSYKEQLEALLLHNKEDLFGLFACSNMLRYQDFFNGAFQVVETKIYEDHFHIRLLLEHSLPNNLTFRQESYSLTVIEDIVDIELLIVQDTLKYFYKNYQDYYYLPQEDTAIHKSVATYVDKAFREKAKLSTCYTRKEGLFLPQYEDKITPAFQRDYKSKPYFFELTESFISDSSSVKSYLVDLFQTIKF